MNPIALISLAITFLQLNKGQTADGKKITMAEKKALVKELKEFTKTTIDALDKLIIPEK